MLIAISIYNDRMAGKWGEECVRRWLELNLWTGRSRMVTHPRPTPTGLLARKRLEGSILPRRSGIR